MIKISEHLYIHMITVILFAVCFVTHQLETALIAYLIMLIHELAHLLAAVCIGLKPERIVIYPCGVNLTLKNKVIYSVSEEIILYAAGPFANIIMALAAVCFFDKIPYSYDFYIQNIALFALNMLPVIPLDGGVITKKVLSYRFGVKNAERLTKVVSVAVVCLIAVLGVYFSFYKKFNYSLCFLCIFLLCNIIMTKEKYNIDFLKELLYSRENKKLGKKVKILSAGEGADLKRIASEFAGMYYYIVFFVNSRGKVTEMLTETEIVEKICLYTIDKKI